MTDDMHLVFEHSAGTMKRYGWSDYIVTQQRMILVVKHVPEYC
jgi:hypothetical protein